MIASSEDERVRISRTGRMASFDGQSISANPYPPDDERHAWWLDGYKPSNATERGSSKV
jgi:hypothetical protein